MDQPLSSLAGKGNTHFRVKLRGWRSWEPPSRVPPRADHCLVFSMETEMSQTALKNHDSEFKSLTFQKRGQINLLTASLSGVTAQLTKTPRNSGRSTHVVCMTRL